MTAFYMMIQIKMIEKRSYFCMLRHFSSIISHMFLFQADHHQKTKSQTIQR